MLIGAVPPILVKSASYPDGTPIKVFDDLRTQLAANRADFYWAFPIPFYSYNREGAKMNEAVRANWWRQAMMGGANAHFLGIKAFSETDFAEDLKTWRAECEVSRQIVAAHDLNDTARPLDWDEDVDLRWLVLRMIAEYAQHCGHVDLLREGVDGKTGA